MNCPHCQSNETRRLKSKTSLGYSQFCCRMCNKQYNERTGTQLNYIEYPTEVVALVVYHYYRFKVSLDDVVELMILRGFSFCHQTVHNWVKTFGVTLGRQCRSKRKGKAGKKWHVDATYLKVEGRWLYLYRAIDKNGDLVDVYLSDTRDQGAAKRFFKQAEITTGVTPSQITTDKERALYPALKNVFGSNTKQHDSKYMNNCIEQHHRGIKSRYKPMKGFKNIFSALIFCTAFEEIQQLLRMKNKTRSERREIILHKIHEFKSSFLQAA